MNNSLIHGRDKTLRVVNLEDNHDGTVTLFIQNEDGTISSEIRTSEYWILTTEQVDEYSKKLDGDRPFKWKNSFTLLDDFTYAKKACYRNKKAKDNSYFVHDLKEQYMLQAGVTYFKGLKHSEVSVLSFDLETTTLEHNKDAKILLISNTFRDYNGNKQRRLFAYDDYKSEKEMIQDWCTFVRECNPSIILGHNIYNFDFLYLDFIARRNNIELTLGRNNKGMKFNSFTSKFRKDQSQFIDYHKCFIFGREIVDTWMLSIKSDVSKKYISYGLKTIIEQEGLQIKDRQFYDASKIRFNYQNPNEWEKIKKYCEHDSDDALALWDLMGANSFYWAQSVPKTLQEIICSATGSQINSIMVRSYLQYNGSLPKADIVGNYEGGISLGFPGIYSNALKTDLLAAYPSTILVYNIYNPKKDPKANFIKMVEYFFIERKKYKKLAKETGDRYYKDMDGMMKQAINSMYGTYGTNGLLYNFPEGAALITEKCRGYIEKAVQWATGRNLEYWKQQNV